MSGIVGIFNRNGEPVRRKTLVSMCDAINHRGPHGRGIWTEGPVGFGHVLLHTTEESLREEQPFSLDGRTWITADARIDDRDGLIDLLKSRFDNSETLQEATDVALLLHAYHVWGVDCVNHIIGVFAAAIWNGCEQKLICLRDHIGIKPFYYAQMRDCLVFASGVKGVLASRLVSPRINEPRIADFLVPELEGIDQTCTFYKEIVRLPPAHRIKQTRNRFEVQKYWSLDFNKEIRFKYQRQYEDAFREVFTRVVHCQLRGGSERVASMLSGGIDSSSIVAIARKCMIEEENQNLQTFSVINSKDPAYSETLNINQVLLQGGLKSYNIDIEDSRKNRTELNNVFLRTSDLFDHNMLIPLIIYKEANRKGLTAVLDGGDGDLVMGQFGNHVAYLLQNFKLKAAFHETRYTCHNRFRDSRNVIPYLFGAFRSAFTPQFLRTFRKSWQNILYQYDIRKFVKDSIISQNFAHRIDLLDRLSTLRSQLVKSKHIDLREIHYNTLNHSYLTAGIERYDRVASIYSIEPRHPILDKRFLEFCFALPWEQRIRDGWTKLIARRSMTHYLPEEVVWQRGKDNLAGKILAKRLSYEADRLQGPFMKGIQNIACYIDLDTVNLSCNEYLSSPKGILTDSGNKVLEALVLFDWITQRDKQNLH